MRLIKCRKCGATIATDETFVQRMMDDINELTENPGKINEIPAAIFNRHPQSKK